MHDRLTFRFVTWRASWLAYKRALDRQHRAEAQFRRAGKRMLLRGLSDAVVEWQSQTAADKQQQTALRLMRKAFARMTKQALVEAVTEWRSSAVADVAGMWYNRAVKLKSVVDECRER